MLGDEITLDDPRADDVRGLLERHLAFARAQAPPEDTHALDLDGLLDPAVMFFSFRQNGELLAIGALKHLDDDHAEVKSMHTAESARGRGIGRAMLEHLISVARDRGYRRVSLETGAMPAFAPARALYASAGFQAAGPFGDYGSSPNSAYMTLALAIPRKMEAIRLHAPGTQGLCHETIETPSLDGGEALVEVHAAALTRDELEWPLDRLPAVPSYELSGVVAAVAEDVDTVKVGDEVYALTPFDRDGVAAEYAVVPASILAPKPATLSHVESAAVPLPALTAWQGLFDHGHLEAGERVLVLGARGGVGQFATQLARRRGALVVDETVAPVDFVFDTVGGDLLARAHALLTTGGRLVSVAEEPPGNGTYFVVEPNREQLIELAGLLDAGVLRVEIDSTFALSEAAAAFERSLARGKRGKVVIQVVGGGE
jgi:NADPH:quinone reductase-like Zn-dependent oxidoreductase/GNAT superfamily N-acetyltransferase